MKKMGESQIIQFFTGVLADEIRSTFGHECQYVIGNFSGSQDRKFADFFAGTDSANILIEFKEFKKEYRDEIAKPLRERLCRTLTEDISNLSRSCHFIGWGAVGSTLNVELNPYIDLVCPLWGCTEHLDSPADYLHPSFINAFVKGTVGVSYTDFVRYIEHLNKTAGGSASGDEAPFRSILFSRNNSGQLVANRFDNLRELRALSNLKPTKKPGHSSGPSMSGP
ncbi:hypothetical protein [Uliginosibacterium sp. TH139]|uniref:hypothetical protein n=1 Tax=Uliginosibacterium sp. TH139 TaxID=2067453 RepID=UPI0011811AB2|nr:hypothetical protein [Uliginosibacterium sp. TH139]